jgi:hypothetical protein
MQAVLHYPCTRRDALGRFGQLDRGMHRALPSWQMRETSPAVCFLVSLFVVVSLPVGVFLPIGCSSDHPGGPTAPQSPATPIDPALLVDLQRQVNDPFFQTLLPHYLGHQEDARPIHALAHAISEDLQRLDAAALRLSLQAMTRALEEYRERPGHAARDETILHAIEICVQHTLTILDGNRRASPEVLPQLSEDIG